MHGFARHVETVRSLSKSKEKEAGRLRKHGYDSHTSSVQRLGAVIAQQPPTVASALVGAAEAVLQKSCVEAAASSRARDPSPVPRLRESSALVRLRDPSPVPRLCEQPQAPELLDASEREARQRRAQCNREIEARQERAIQKVRERRSLECARTEKNQAKSQWRAHRAKGYLLDAIKDPELKWHVERTSKPRVLPKLPRAPISGAPTPLSATSTQENQDSAEPSEDFHASAASTASRSDASPVASSPTGSNRSTCQALSLPSSATADVTKKADTPEEATPEADHMPKLDAAPQVHDLPDITGDSGIRPALPHEGVVSSDEGAGAEKTEEPELLGSKDEAGLELAEERKESKEPEGRVRGSVQSFLERQRISLASRVCSSMPEWKRHQQCRPEQKVFACCGGYPDFRDALLRRGWFQNPNKDSTHFDLKWGMVCNIDHEHLQPHQVVNHFDKCRDLTTKVGLTLALRSSTQLSDTSIDHYYPRAFDLYDPLDRADFVLDFKLTKAESVLRRFLEHVDGKETMTFSQDVVHVASRIAMRLITDVDEVIDCEEMAESLGGMANSDWKLLEKANLDNVLEDVERIYTKTELEELIHKKASTTSRVSASQRAAAEKEKEKELLKNKLKKAVSKIKKKKKAEAEEVPISAAMSSYDCPRGQFYIRQARSILEEMETKNQQHCINGSRNAWIVKPSGKSRGRGIQMLRELEEIFRVTESDGFQWICQKYIEQPQLIHGYKFDIRQWVLVTDWNPLTYYIWTQPYIRFAGQKYDDSCEDYSAYMHLVNNSIIKKMDGFDEINEDLNASGFMWFRQDYEKWLHKTYCKCEHHHTPWLKDPPYTCDTFGVRWEDVKFTAKDEEDSDNEEADDPGASSASASAVPARPPSPPQCQPCQPQAAGSTEGEVASDSASKDASSIPDDTPECENLWMTCIKPQIEDIVLSSLRCVSDSVTHRKNSVELYGYDFMLSERKDGPPKVWLIEVNSSPACDYSTPVTCPLVKQMMEDTAKILVDLREDPEGPTGEWERIHHEHGAVPPNRKGCPVDLTVCGKQMKKPKTKKKKKKKKKLAEGDTKNEQEDEDGRDGEGADEVDDDSGGGAAESDSES